MNIKRFFGKNSREALSMVRKELGDDAVILSNRAVNGGNEIMAFREDEMNSIMSSEPRVSNIGVSNTGANNIGMGNIGSQSRQQREESYEDLPATPTARRDRTFDDSEPPSLLSVLTRKSASASHTQPTASSEFSRRAEQSTADSNSRLVHQHWQGSQQPMQTQQMLNTTAQSDMPAAASSIQQNQQMADMLNEMRVMRNAIESQLTAMSWGNIQQREPVKSRILSTLLAAGFSAALSRQVAEKVPASLSYERALVWTQSILSRNLKTIDSETEILDQGGIFALIGPTGVGKTTTTAKLAARYVMKHGTQNLGLITTDAYRVGGHEQLRIYGKILGVMVYAVKDEADLKIALNELKNKHTILIDTVGVSQRDRMVAQQIAMLSNTHSAIKKLLCLNATNTGETLTDVVRAYKGKGLDGCIITKVDEAATIGNALDVAIREKLKLYYVANGQRVPEDIHMANKQQLIRHAMKLSTTSNNPFHFRKEELPFVMGGTVSATTNQLVETGNV